MKPLVVSRTIAAPPDRVFALLSDFASAPARGTGIVRVEMLTDGPVRVGTRFRETRKFGGREATEEMEVAAYDPPRSYSLRALSCGVEFVSEVRCVAEGAGTRAEIEVRGTPKSLFARLMTPLASLMRGAMEKCVLADLDGIAKAAES